MLELNFLQQEYRAHIESQLVKTGSRDEAFSKLAPTDLQQMVDILSSDAVQDLCTTDQLTVALIKPELVEGTHGFEGLSDSEIKDHLLTEIKPPLQKVFEVSCKMPDQIVDEWYIGTPRERQLQVQPIQDPGFPTRWHEYKAFMTSHPSTFILLASEEGDAVKEWRRQMGNNWNISEIIHEEPESLRARFALNNH